MKSKSIRYKIEEPCHADWDQMKPEAAGRFCSECSKTVIDFSSMSDFSIVTYLEKNKHQSVCGRFTQTQLDKIEVWPKPPHGLFQFDLKAVALGLALSTFSAIPSQAQQGTGTELYFADTNELVEVKQGEVALSYDHTGESFAAGKVKLEGKNSGVIRIRLMDGNSNELAVIEASKNGTFRIPLDWKKNPASIQVSASGFMTQVVYFENHESLGNLMVTLHDRMLIKGKIVRQDD